MKDETRFISPLSDYGFKVVFADEKDTLFLRKALQALIQTEVPIAKVTFLRNEFFAKTQDARGGVFDLICEDENKNTYIVEMQLGPYKHFIQRSKFYAFQKFDTLVKKGKFKFENLTPIYSIGILAKPIFPNSKEYYHFGQLKNQKSEVLDEQITHIILEISKFEKSSDELETDLDKLIYVMKNLEIMQAMKDLPPVLNEEWMQKAIEKLNTSRMTAEQRMHYEMMLARNGSILAMEEEAKAEMRREVKAEVKKEIKAEVKKEMRREVKAEVKKEIKAEVKKEMRREVKAEVKKEIKAEVKKEMRREVKAEVKKEIKAEVEAEVKKEVKAELEKEVRKVGSKENAKKLKTLGVAFKIISEATGLNIEEIKNL